MNGYIARVADEIADLLLREGIDYVQSKAVFRAARIKAGLTENYALCRDSINVDPMEFYAPLVPVPHGCPGI